MYKMFRNEKSEAEMKNSGAVIIISETHDIDSHILQFPGDSSCPGWGGPPSLLPAHGWRQGRASFPGTGGLLLLCPAETVSNRDRVNTHGDWKLIHCLYIVCTCT